MHACRELLEEVSHGFFTVNYPQFVRCYEVRSGLVTTSNMLHAHTPASLRRSAHTECGLHIMSACILSCGEAASGSCSFVMHACSAASPSRRSAGRRAAAPCAAAATCWCRAAPQPTPWQHRRCVGATDVAICTKCSSVVRMAAAARTGIHVCCCAGCLRLHPIMQSTISCYWYDSMITRDGIGTQNNECLFQPRRPALGAMMMRDRTATTLRHGGNRPATAAACARPAAPEPTRPAGMASSA
jgi:hypothetical protein